MEALCTNLRELAAYSAVVHGDINKTNQYFDENYSQLVARGAQINDPMGTV